MTGQLSPAEASQAVETTLKVGPQALEWDTYAPRYDALLQEELEAAGVADWLSRWSDLSAEVMEVASKLGVHADLHTDQSEVQQRYRDFVGTVIPAQTRAEHALIQKLLAVKGYEPPADFALNYRRMRDEAALFREANVELNVVHTEQVNRHSVLTGNQQVKLGEEVLTVPQVKQRLDSLDHEERRAAWEALGDAATQLAPELDTLMSDLLQTRRQLARNADQADYRAFRWLELDRVDYTPADCVAFHEAVRDEVVPLLSEYLGHVAQARGLDSLRPWDYNRNAVLEAQAQAPLRPFEGGAAAEALAQRTFDALDSELAGRFRQMREGGLLDIESRPGKMPHAYCSYFPVRNQPFVLMNVVGTGEDVRVLFHEVGHAFHGFLSGAAQPLVWNRWSPIEFVEIPSMAMEFLTLAHLTPALGEDGLRRYRECLLAGVMAFLPWAAQMDAFQHWLYAEAGEDVSTEQLDAKWLELERTYHPFVNWEGLNEAQRAKGWQYHHILQLPFYYIEYAMCYLAAVAIWRASLQDPQGTLERYKAALRLGNTVSVPQLYQAAGVEFRFDREYIRGLMDFLRGQLALS